MWNKWAATSIVIIPMFRYKIKVWTKRVLLDKYQRYVTCQYRKCLDCFPVLVNGDHDLSHNWKYWKFLCLFMYLWNLSYMSIDQNISILAFILLSFLWARRSSFFFANIHFHTLEACFIVIGGQWEDTGKTLALQYATLLYV